MGKLAIVGIASQALANGTFTFLQQLQSNQESRKMPYDVPQLLAMSQKELDALFTNSVPGDIPTGEANGTAIVAPGTTYTLEIASFINHFAWQGKSFDGATGTLKNRILPFGLNAIIAKVYKGNSWLDGKECIVLDYSETSLVAHWIRDEIRQIGPGMYLGKVYWDKDRLIDFALEF
jgi:hypothetical protein